DWSSDVCSSDLTIFSYLLIGHYFDRKGSRRSAMQAIIVTTLGGLAMLGGFIILGETPGGSYSLSELVAHPPTGWGTSTAVVLVLVGALTKRSEERRVGKGGSCEWETAYEIET